MTTPLDVDVVIVAHNAGDLLAASVRSASDEAVADRVWVVDAESTDGSVERATAADPRIHVLAVPNAGFSASNNRGIEATSREWVLLLNPDAELERGALSAMYDAATTDPRIGVVGPLVLQPEGGVQPESFGSFPSLRRRIAQGASRVLKRVSRGADSSPKAPTGLADVDWVTGACMLVRRSAICDAGQMDEGFFLYYEDVEWCHRMKDRGWRVVVAPAARCVHHLGKSDAPSDFVAKAYRESFYRYCDLYGLWGLKMAAKMAVAIRKALGGRA